MKTARQVWYEMAMRYFPLRHDKNPTVKRNIRDLLKSLFNHGRNWRLWKEDKLPKPKV